MGLVQGGPAYETAGLPSQVPRRVALAVAVRPARPAGILQVRALPVPFETGGRATVPAIGRHTGGAARPAPPDTAEVLRPATAIVATVPAPQGVVLAARLASTVARLGRPVLGRGGRALQGAGLAMALRNGSRDTPGLAVGPPLPMEAVRVGLGLPLGADRPALPEKPPPMGVGLGETLATEAGREDVGGVVGLVPVPRRVTLTRHGVRGLAPAVPGAHAPTGVEGVAPVPGVRVGAQVVVARHSPEMAKGAVLPGPPPRHVRGPGVLDAVVPVRDSPVRLAILGDPRGLVPPPALLHKAAPEVANLQAAPTVTETVPRSTPRRAPGVVPTVRPAQEATETTPVRLGRVEIDTNRTALVGRPVRVRPARAEMARETHEVADVAHAVAEVARLAGVAGLPGETRSPAARVPVTRADVPSPPNADAVARPHARRGVPAGPEAAPGGPVRRVAVAEVGATRRQGVLLRLTRHFTF